MGAGGRPMSQTKCKGCGKLFAKRASDRNTYCTSNCKGVTMAERWRPCATCMATIGMTASMASKLLGIIGRPQVTKYWRDNCPDRDASAIIAAQKAHKRGLAKKLPIHIKQPHKVNQLYNQARMSDIKPPRFPDWGHVWSEHKAQSDYLKSYNSPEKQYERACMRDIRLHKSPTLFPDWSAKWRNSRMSMTPEKRAADNLRTRLKRIMRAVKSESLNGYSSLVGCTTKQLKEHLESQFHSGMSWDNYGTRWHVDHIMPVSAFDQSSIEQRKTCWNFNNLCPLPASDNIRKRNAITEPQLPLPLAL